MATNAPTIGALGISAPDYPTILSSITSGYRAIYGPNAYLEPDSQDGAFLAILALAQFDTNSAIISAYNNQSPATAQGEGLSRVVKINGIARMIPTYSTATVTLSGDVGTLISRGIVQDAAQGRWFIATDVMIPSTGQVMATVTFEAPGAMTALPGTLTVIGSPTLGWQGVTNAAAATPGAPVESDAALRVRQTLSTALPSRSILDGIVGAISALMGVARVAAYDNDRDVADVNGVPAHTIALVIDGGDGQTIANTIGAKKGPGIGTFGTTTFLVSDVYKIPQVIAFFRPTTVLITLAISLKTLPGYATADGTAMINAVVAYINALPIATAVRLSRLYAPIDAAASTYNVTAITMARPLGTLAAADIAIGYTEAAICTPASVTLTIVP